METTGSFVLGLEYKDKVTGSTGIATGYVQYLTGCNQVLLNHKCEKGKNNVESTWFDVNRLEHIGKKEIVLTSNPNERSIGFDTAAPTNH